MGEGEGKEERERERDEWKKRKSSLVARTLLPVTPLMNLNCDYSRGKRIAVAAAAAAAAFVLGALSAPSKERGLGVDLCV